MTIEEAEKKYLYRVESSTEETMSGNNLSSAPKILLAKPSLVTSGSIPGSKLVRSGGGTEEDSASSLRSRLPSIGSLNLLSDSWEFHTDRFLPFLTENIDFTVIGVIGPPGVGKSTIMNEIYGYDSNFPGMLPPFATQSEDIRALARHCTTGMEPRISSERIILLDTQPVFSPSILAEMMRPDGSSTIPVLGGESLSAELAHELMSIQLGILLTSICHIVLVVSEGTHDVNLWRLMLTVDLLKHDIPDPSTSNLAHANLGTDKETREKASESEYMATPIFVHTKLRDQEIYPQNIASMKKALAQYFRSSTFVTAKNRGASKSQHTSSIPQNSHTNDSLDPNLLKIFPIPLKNKDDCPVAEYESYNSMLWRLRDQILSMNCPSFARTVSERDWLKNSAKIWELIKSSPIIFEYGRTLQSSGLFRR